MTNTDIETNAFQNEYFPFEKPYKKSKKEKKKSQSKLTKLLAATIVMGTGVIAVQNAIPLDSISPPIESIEPLPIYKSPEFNGIQVSAYTSEDTSQAEYKPPTYIASFPFHLNDGKPLYVEITGEAFETAFNNQNVVSTPVNAVIPYEMLTFKDGTVTADYYIENAYIDHYLTATLYYEIMNAETGVPETKFLQTDTVLAGISRLIPSEMNNNNEIQVTVDGNIIHCKLTVRDFKQGVFDFKVENLYYEAYNDQLGIIESKEISELAELPIAKDGTILYEFDIPKPDADYVEIHINLDGDSYLNGEKLNISSSTFCSTEVIFGESYSVSPVSFDKTASGMTVNGLTVDRIEFISFYGAGYQNGLEKVLPGRQVSMSIVLKGKALEETQISADISVNTGKITDLDTTYAQNVTVYKDSEEVYLEVYFTMPAENITVGDIVLNGVMISNTEGA